MMKNFIFFILIVYGLASCNSNNVRAVASSEKETVKMTAQTAPTDSIKSAYLSLDKTLYDFGKIKKKKTPHLAIEFQVENRGEKPLIIIKGDVSCGCVSVNYPKEPILPGKKAELVVNVETRNQKGSFNKAVFIKSNAENDVALIRITGEIR